MTKKVDWMHDVLSDLESFSKRNALSRVAEKIREAKLVLDEESSSISEFGQKQTKARTQS